MSKVNKIHFQRWSVRSEKMEKKKLFLETGIKVKEEKYAIVKLLISINTVG